MFATVFKAREVRKRYWWVWFDRRLLLLVLLFIPFVVSVFVFFLSFKCFFLFCYSRCFSLVSFAVSFLVVSFFRRFFLLFLCLSLFSFFFALFVVCFFYCSSLVFLCFKLWLLIWIFFVLLWLLGETWSGGGSRWIKLNETWTKLWNITSFVHVSTEVHPSVHPSIHPSIHPFWPVLCVVGFAWCVWELLQKAEEETGSPCAAASL